MPKYELKQIIQIGICGY